MNNIYFAHPVNTYNTELETELLDIIAEHFPDYDIENPNQKKHEEGYQAFKRDHGSGMEYYFTQVLPNMDAGIFLPFEDGMFGAGVYKEAQWLQDHGKPLYEINSAGTITDLVLSEERKLSVQETRSRVYP